MTKGKEVVLVWEILNIGLSKVSEVNPEIDIRKIRSNILSLLKKEELKKSKNKDKTVDNSFVEWIEIKTLRHLTQFLCFPILKSWNLDNYDWITREQIEEVMLKTKAEIALRLNPSKIDELISALNGSWLEKITPWTLVSLYKPPKQFGIKTQYSRVKELYMWFCNNVKKQILDKKSWEVKQRIDWDYIMEFTSQYSDTWRDVAWKFVFNNE